jgi:HK97 family phage prohead protease
VLEYRCGGALTRATRPEARAADGADGAEFVGQAIVYNQRTFIGRSPWGWYEEIDPGALGDQLDAEDSDVAFLWNHNSDFPISRTRAGTLTLTNTSTALDVLSGLNTAKSYVADLVANLDDETVVGMSFGFYVEDDDWQWITVGTDDNGHDIRAELRRILALTVIEVSAVTFPAFGQTSAGLRSACEAIRARHEALTSDPAPAVLGRADDLRLKRFAALQRRYGK